MMTIGTISPLAESGRKEQHALVCPKGNWLRLFFWQPGGILAAGKSVKLGPGL